MITLQAFKTAFPAFANVPEPTAAYWMAQMPKDFETARWGADLEEGQMCWLAHMLVIAGADGFTQTGEAKPKVEANDVVMRINQGQGGMSVSRSAAGVEAQARDPFQRTTWGQRYRYLARLHGMGAVVP